MIRASAVIAAMLVASGCGGEERPARAPDPFKAVDPGSVLDADRAIRSAPRWERLARMQGTREQRRSFAIGRDVIRWRVGYGCAGGGYLKVAVTPPPQSGSGVREVSCPARGRLESMETGEVSVSVSGESAWTAVVERQVDTPIDEPPLRAMSSRRAPVVARGEFRRIDRRTAGRVTLYRLPGGRLALRLENFLTSANTDLEVWISPARGLRTSQAAVRARHVSVAALKATAGPQNYVLPRGTRPEDVRSVVLWCEPLYVAYGAAELRPER